MNVLSEGDRAKLLAVRQAALELCHSPIDAVRNYALHVTVETRCILDQLLIIPPDDGASR
jgi:hypothetical protein